MKGVYRENVECRQFSVHPFLYFKIQIQKVFKNDK